MVADLLQHGGRGRALTRGACGLWWLLALGLPAVAGADRLEEARAQLARCIGPIGARPALQAEVRERQPFAPGLERQSVRLETAAGDVVDVTATAPVGRPGPYPVVLYVGSGSDVRPADPRLPGRMTEISPPVELAERGFLAIEWSGPRPEGAAALAALVEGRTELGRLLRQAGLVLDYLAGRGDADPKRLTCLAREAEGWPGVALAILDERVRALVSVGAISTAAGFAQAVDRWPDSVLVPGLFERRETWDYLALTAPRPVLLVSSPGHLQAQPLHVDQLQRMAQLAGGGRIEVQRFRAQAGFDVEMRKAVYRWLAQWPEPAQAAETTARTLWDVLSAEPSTAPAPGRDGLSRLLGDVGRTPIQAQIRASTDESGLLREDVTIPSSFGHLMQAVLLRPAQADGPLPGVICLHRWVYPFALGKEEPAGLAGDASHAVGRMLALRGYAVLCPDTVGHGSYISSALALNYRRQPEQRLIWPATAQLWQKSTALRLMVDDVAQWLDLLALHPAVDAGRVALLGEGDGATCALFAAALNERIALVVCVNGPAPDTALHNDTTPMPGVYVPELARFGGTAAVAALLRPRPSGFILPLDERIPEAAILAEAAGGEVVEAADTDRAPAAAAAWLAERFPIRERSDEKLVR